MEGQGAQSEYNRSIWRTISNTREPSTAFAGGVEYEFGDNWRDRWAAARIPE